MIHTRQFFVPHPCTQCLGIQHTLQEPRQTNTLTDAGPTLSASLTDAVLRIMEFPHSNCIK